MNILEAIRERHSVRRYKNIPLKAEDINELESLIAACNEESGLHIQLLTNEPKAFAKSLLAYGRFSGVSNYLLMAGPEKKEEEIGYFGEKLVIAARMNGIDSCWVGLTYKKIPGTFTLAAGEKVYCVIALGYGESHGVQHPLKAVESLYKSEGDVPGWFMNGMSAVQLAPSAVNQQKYRFILHGDNVVECIAGKSYAGYTKIDLGIAKYHFEAGAGKDIEYSFK